MKIISANNQNYLIAQTAQGEVAMNLGTALAAADGDSDAKSVIRTTKNLAGFQNRVITETEAIEALAAAVVALNEKAALLVEEFNNCFVESKAVAIETQIVAALSV